MLPKNSASVSATIASVEENLLIAESIFLSTHTYPGSSRRHAPSASSKPSLNCFSSNLMSDRATWLADAQDGISLAMLGTLTD
eukprot:CAMPEP_0118806026 /NCGR_PEP_ID=MMETSP1161-20130426/29806_1 /TAXON_ID=249345 /ORGANISM="Picochlorum oklahomensis, Strain CCMP2329" /LENGTH=82 /DNA_ID=CAMNT_0006735103 /DNA_START=36 /DNA_END=281 /DNA_ORIENTATION=-